MLELRKVVLARSLQMIKSSSGTIGYLPDLAKQVKDQYSFIKGPKNEDLLPSDPPKGAEFQHGKLVQLSRIIIIDKLTVFSDGIVVDTSSSTDDSDLCLNDLAQWALTATPGVTQVGPRYYLSQMEVHMDPPLATRMPQFQLIGERTTARLAGYGIQAPVYQPSVIHMYYDTLGKPAPQPGAFVLERRLNIPHSENVWFSQAPLRTWDHMQLLGELEKI